MLDSLIKQRNYDEASTVILEIERRFAFGFDFEAAPEYDDFRQSEAYAELQKTWAASAGTAK